MNQQTTKNYNTQINRNTSIKNASNLNSRPQQNYTNTRKYVNQQNYNNINKDNNTNNSKRTAQPVTSTNYNNRQNNNYNYSNINKTNISRSTLQSNVNNNMQQSNNKNNTLQSTGYSKVNYNSKYEKLREIEGIFKIFEEDGHRGEYKGMAIKIVKGLTDILRSDPERSDNNLSKRVCKIVDEINNDVDGTLWSLSSHERNGEILFSFLNELAADWKFVPQIDRIFRSGFGTYPLVNKISRNYENKFNELFQKLPEWYQNKLLGETISYEEGDKTYTCSLIGETALMGF